MVDDFQINIHESTEASQPTEHRSQTIRNQMMDYSVTRTDSSSNSSNDAIRMALFCRLRGQAVCASFRSVSFASRRNMFKVNASTMRRTETIHLQPSPTANAARYLRFVALLPQHRYWGRGGGGGGGSVMICCRMRSVLDVRFVRIIRQCVGGSHTAYTYGTHICMHLFTYITSIRGQYT